MTERKRNSKVTQQGTVVHSDEHYVYVSVKQSTACDGCMKKDGCDGCASYIEVKAHNDCMAKEGDRVEVSTSTGRVLLFALVVFVFPFIPALAVYFVVASATEGEFLPICAAFAALLVFFLCLRVTVDRSAEKRCDQHASRILSDEISEDGNR